jgi:hypothetical protein
MGILIGMDEAGYGPRYGPLVVAATAWEVDEEQEQLRNSDCGLRNGSGDVQSAIRNPQSEIRTYNLYRALRGAVTKSPSEFRIGIADSKALYRPKAGLRQLERGIHAVLAAMNRPASCWSAMVDTCAADPAGHHRGLCWHDGFDCRLPIDEDPDKFPKLVARLREKCEASGVLPIDIRARLVFPEEFNALVNHFGSKGDALSHVTIGLLREVIYSLPVGSRLAAEFADSNLGTAERESSSHVFVVCDKHGARNRYGALLQHHFSEHWVSPVHEGPAESCYEWGAEVSRVRVVFRVRGEKYLQTALASMTAKYLRELAMRAFNEFWCAHLPGLIPTAGYPKDANRFRDAISSKQRELKIDDGILWRNR